LRHRFAAITSPHPSVLVYCTSNNNDGLKRNRLLNS
jgi:hypothetical protein